MMSLKAKQDGCVYVLGRTEGGNQSIWRADSYGQLTNFITLGPSYIAAMDFGADGTLYIAQTWEDQVTISRVALVPEPATILLISSGIALGFCRKRK